MCRWALIGVVLAEGVTVLTVGGVALAEDRLERGVAAVAERYPDGVLELIAAAEGVMGVGPFSVMQKTALPPSGDRHDFFSLSPYHWPNPDTPDGLPYVYRDGKKNPQVDGPAYDRMTLFEMRSAVEKLAMAYSCTHDAKYADRASFLIRTWFLSPTTRMNPNLTYAQFIPGETHQRPWGVIRGLVILDVCDAVEWISDSASWTKRDAENWEAWLRDYMDWLLNSNHGRAEAKAFNNHGTWYDVQVARLGLACGRKTVAEKILSEVGRNRIAKQIQPNGSQFFELMRAKSWDYSLMNLEGFFKLADLSDAVGISLWEFETEDGRSIRAALDYLVPYGVGQKTWTHKQVVPLDVTLLVPLLRKASLVYPEYNYDKVIFQIHGHDEAAR